MRWRFRWKRDTCSGGANKIAIRRQEDFTSDSGGPIRIEVADNRYLYHILRITSNSPGVYTGASSY